MISLLNKFPFFLAAGLFLLTCVCSEGTEIRHAKNLTVETHDGFNVVTVRNAFKGSGKTEFQYVLLSSDMPVPEGYPEAVFVEIPVKRVISLSTTFLGFIDELDEVDSLVGIGSFRYTNTTAVVEKIKKDELVEVGSESSKNIELIVSLAPDIVFTNALGNPDQDIHPVFNRMGILSVLTAAYMEETLLGRAEWIKFVAAFYDKLEMAETLFSKTESEYNALRNLTAGIQNRPTVFANAPWGNVWYTPSGISFIAHAIQDAGGHYLWADDRNNGTLPLDFETVYERVIDAQFWINTGYLDSMSVLLSNDDRYQDFRAVKDGNVYSESNRLNESGGNDIWERGVIHPQEILADLIKIFHPDHLPEHEFVFYRKVE